MSGKQGRTYRTALIGVYITIPFAVALATYLGWLFRVGTTSAGIVVVGFTALVAATVRAGYTGVFERAAVGRDALIGIACWAGATVWVPVLRLLPNDLMVPLLDQTGATVLSGPLTAFFLAGVFYLCRSGGAAIRSPIRTFITAAPVALPISSGSSSIEAPALSGESTQPADRVDIVADTRSIALRLLLVWAVVAVALILAQVVPGTHDGIAAVFASVFYAEAVFAVMVLVVAVRYLTNRAPMLTIASDGISIRPARGAIRYLPWAEISGFEMKRYKMDTYLVIHVRNPDALLAQCGPISRWFMGRSRVILGSPVRIAVNFLKCDRSWLWQKMNEMLATRMNDMFVGTYWSARQESSEQAVRRVAGFLRAISSTADGVLSEWFHSERTQRAAPRVRIDSTPEGVEPYLRVNRRDLDREVMPELGFSFDVWNGRDVSFRVTVGAYSPHVGNAAVLSFQGPIQLGDADWRKLLDAAIEAFDPEHGVVTSLAELARAGVGHSQVRCMTKQLLFFATKEDLRPLLAAVEGVVPIDYVLMGIYPAEVAEKYGSIEDIPNLGRATTDSAISSREFLVVKKNCTVNMESVATVHGKRYVIDQLLNPSSVTFAPGGLWGSDVLLNGRFATVHDDEDSRALMKQFATVLRKSFRKLKAYWIGPEAERLLEAGKRLTISAQTPRDFDLSKTG